MSQYRLSLLYIAFYALTSPTVAWAYPQFIGYKYSSCLTCHYNGNGNGPLNDYGRALWAAEIAGRLWSSNNEEELGEASGFLGKKPLPWWLRPGFKARQLWYQTDPGGSTAHTRAITMQAEVNAAMFLDKQQKNMFMVSYGYVPVPNRFRGQPPADKMDEWISREHYFRWQKSKDLWFYIGMFDKPFGIRHVNHSAYSRKHTGLAQNDQAHGILAQMIKPKWELSFNGFLGNLFQESNLQQRGFSTLFEYEPRAAWRVGASYLSQASKFLQNQRLSGHTRYGFGYGSSLMFELGIIQNTPRDFTNRRGYYIYSEAMQKIRRGYHLFVVGQAYKERMESGYQNELKFGTGFLMFPMQRFEFRIEAENSRQLSSFTQVQKESWALLTQLHVAL